MSRVEIRHTIISALSQLSEVQQLKLLESINSLLVIKKPEKSKIPSNHKMRQVQIITDESFDYEPVEFPPALLSKNTFTSTVVVGKAEKLKPTIILE